MMSSPDLSALDARTTPDTALSAEERRQLAASVAGWHEQDGALERTWRFPDFHHTMAFVNAVAWIAHQADHHPDMAVGYGHCTLRWNTHSSGALTLKDFICAAQVNALKCPQA